LNGVDIFQLSVDTSKQLQIPDAKVTVAPLSPARAWWTVRCGISFRTETNRPRESARGFRVFRQGEGVAGTAQPVHG
jgi:hypothetical protein